MPVQNKKARPKTSLFILGKTGLLYFRTFSAFALYFGATFFGGFHFHGFGGLFHLLGGLFRRFYGRFFRVTASNNKQGESEEDSELQQLILHFE